MGFGTHNLALVSFSGASFHGIFVLLLLLLLLRENGRKHHGEILNKITTMIEKEELKPILDPRIFKFDDALSAYEAV